MNNHDIGTKPTMAQTLDALDFMRQYAIHFAELPAPYISVHSGWYGATSVRMIVDMDAFEAWREALEIPSSGITMCPSSSRDESYLMADHTVSIGVKDRVLSIEVHLSAPVPFFDEERTTPEQVTA